MRSFCKYKYFCKKLPVPFASYVTDKGEALSGYEE